MKRLFVVLILFISIYGGPAYGDSFDFTNFSGEPPELAYNTGDTITLEEDPSGFVGLIYFLNNNYNVRDNALTLSFDYQFTLKPGDADWLIVKIDDEYTTEISGDNSSGDKALILSDSASIDLIPYQGRSVSLVFGLEYDWDHDWAYSSAASISNLKILTSPTTAVPEPATFLSLGLGLAGLTGLRTRIFLRKKAYLLSS